MCGIIGALNIEKSKIEAGLQEILHRGPDYHATFSKSNLVLGHARLSIMDLEEGSNQPFIYGSHVLVFNGEIYNFLSLKEQLLQLGVNFTTTGDTEVLLHWLIRFGKKGLNVLDGMFAFAWFNGESEELMLCRDHLGIKPLYFYHSSSELIFCSEIKGVFAVAPELRQIDKGLIAEYLLNGFIYEPETGFSGIRKVDPGSYSVYNLQNELVEQKKYWDPLKIPTGNKKSSLDQLIKNTIKEQFAADVPVGLFFSGGIDSSIILSELTANIKPITIRSEEFRYTNSGMTSDYLYAGKVAEIFNIELNEVSLEDNLGSNFEFLDSIQEVAEGNEELMYDFTYQSSRILSERARELGYTVMLSGMGADELFGGYPRYRLVKYAGFFRIVRPFIFLLRKNKYFAKKIERFNSFFDEDDFVFRYASLVGVFNRREVKELTLGLTNEGIGRFKNKMDEKLSRLKGTSNLKKAIFLDLSGFLAHNFSVADKSSMKESIELRVPLATKDLFEFAWQSKDSQLLSFRRNKLPLRNYLLGKLPKSIVDRKKAGFNAPMDDSINRLGERNIMEVLDDNRLFEILEKPVVSKIVAQHFSGGRNNTYKIYQLLHLSYWLKSNFNGKTD